VGVYALRSTIGDVVTAVVFGVAGYLMIRFRFPRITLVIALILGEIAERSFHQALNMADGDWTIFFTRGIALFLAVLTAGCLVFPAVQAWRRRRLPESSS
jgi:putative tricarboxylic transport membrane protein